MKKERFIITFSAVLVVCLLIAGYSATTATYRAADAPPVDAAYRAEVLTYSGPATDVDPDSLPGKWQEMQNAVGSGIASTVSVFATDAGYASRIAENCGETITDWQSVDLTGGEKIYLAKGTKLVLRKGAATCIESASTGLTDRGVSRTLEQGDDLAIGTLYEATVPAAGFYAASSCTAIFSGDYSLS